MEKIVFSKMAIGDTCEGAMMVTELKQALTKRGNPYSRLELCDGDVKVDAKSWDSPEKFETQGICVGAVISGTVACSG